MTKTEMKRKALELAHAKWRIQRPDVPPSFSDDFQRMVLEATVEVLLERVEVLGRGTIY